MNTIDNKSFKLKTMTEIGVMLDNPNITELVNYIDKLHNIIKDYQIVVDVAVNKNINVRS